MITVRTAQKAYTAVYNRGDAQQPMTSYALGGCHQGNGFASDVFTMQRRPQFGAICCVVATALAGAVLSTGSFEKALENRNTHALEVAITKSFKGITKGHVDKLVEIIRTHTDGFKALMGTEKEDPKILEALEGEPELLQFLKKFDS